MGSLQVLVDGKPVELPPRREEMVRQLLAADLDIDTVGIAALEFRLAQDKVSMRFTKSHPAVRVLSWWQWVKHKRTA